MIKWATITCGAALLLSAADIRGTIVNIPILEDASTSGYWMADGGNPEFSHPFLQKISGTGGNMPAYSWYKFDLSSVPADSVINSVTFNISLLYRSTYFIGAYYCSDDSWHESLVWSDPGITWNNQPLWALDASPLDAITPEAGIATWNVTAGGSRAYSDDKVLSLMLRFVNEEAAVVTSGFGLHSDAFLEIDYSPVPEPSTVWAGVLCAIPFGVMLLRTCRRPAPRL